MRKIAGFVRMAAIGLPVLFAVSAVQAQSGPPTAEQLAAQIDALKQDYERRIAALEAQIAAMKARPPAAGKAAPASKPPMRTGDNSFNPAIGVVLNAMYSEYSEDSSGLPGFQLGHESERPDEGLALGHSELTMSGNVDDKFRGNLTLGLGAHGSETELELEEAYIQTLAGSGLPDGVRIKAGRALWTFGYMNEQHAHGDDFVDRPLPYKAFLDGAYNDDGLELSVVLPGDIYTELGGGLFRGGDMPFGGSETGREAWSAFARVGGDVGSNSELRLGAYVLDGQAHDRGPHEDEHEHEEGEGDDHGHHAELFSEGAFTGDTRLAAVDFRYTWAPTGNARNSELILQGEYFHRSEEGLYALEECDDDQDPPVCTLEEERLNGDASGWYAQAVYKFLPRWRVGARYSRLSPPSDAELDRDLYSISTMLDWTNSEFGRIRFQYNRDSFGPERDEQFILQYVMSLGAHAAHAF